MNAAPARREFRLPIGPRALRAVLAVLALGSCAPEPLEFADWIIEVPEGTPIRQFAAVPADQRDPDGVRFADELIFGADLSDPQQGLFRPSYMVASGGTVFVVDSAALRVQMFDQQGRYLKTLGKEGQGPGEFRGIGGMTIAGDLLVIDDGGNRRFSVWTLDGEHVRDYRQESGVTRSGGSTQGLEDGTVISLSTANRGGQRVQIVVRLTLDGQELKTLHEIVPAPPTVADPSWTAAEFGQALIGLYDDPRRIAAVGVNQAVYVSPVLQYQVLALDPDGTAQWALRRAGPRPGFSSLVKETILSRLRGDEGDVAESDLDWPSEYRAIGRLLTDGHGRLYVMPEVGFVGEPPSKMPVDVYSPEGEFLVAGYVPVRWPELGGLVQAPWFYAEDDYVYGLRETDSGENVAVRYRLVLNDR